MRPLSFQLRTLIALLVALPGGSIGTYSEVAETTWTQAPSSKPQRDSSVFAGVQGDRSRENWSGNGGRPHSGSAEGVLFSGKALAKAPAISPSSRLVTPPVNAATKIKPTPSSVETPRVAEQMPNSDQIPPSPVMLITPEGSNFRLSWLAVASSHYEIMASSRVEGPYQQVQTLSADSDGQLSAVLQPVASSAYFYVRLKNNQPDL